MPAHELDLRSLTIATDIDVLSDDSVVEQRERYLVVRTPSNPTYFWGNFLLYPEPPTVGDRATWEADFAREISALQPESYHVALAWDRNDGAVGAAREEFVAAGYDLELDGGLVAAPEEFAFDHPRAATDVEVRALDPREGADEAAWAGVRDVQMQNAPPGHSGEAHMRFLVQRERERRARFVAGDGAWYAAWVDGRVVATLGIVVTNGRARYQAVDTAEAYRSRGIASRLILEAARDALDQFGAEQFVIVADTAYHAIDLYRSLGFEPRETIASVQWWPTGPTASLHPEFEAAASG